MGHTTRCIPIISYLLSQDCDVCVAAEGQAATLLQTNFPGLEILPLRGYRVSYARNAGGFALKILTQVPKIVSAIGRERRWLKELVKQRKFDLIISDNRYGLKVPGVPSVIMTHQLQIKSGKGALIDRLIQNAHYRILQTFDECWVVDRPGLDNLADELAHPKQLPVNAKYIGWLSQLRASEAYENVEGSILILLSGPEPTRTMLEVLLLEQCAALDQYKFTFVAGTTTGTVPDGLPGHINYHTYVNAKQLSQILQTTSLVVCRSGYSTLMDLAIAGKKALLIPTPGQPEQEYLAERLMARGFFLYQDQAWLNLSADIPKALSYSGFEVADRNGGEVALSLKEAIARFIN